MTRILFKNPLLVTMNPEKEVVKSDLLVEDTIIRAIGTELGPADRVIDAADKVMIPGLIQSHIHLCQTLFRGQADDLELLDWLKKRIWPLEGAHDVESIYVSACLGIGELFRGGTTAIVDMETVNYTESALRAIVETGIRAVSGKVMMDFGEDVPATLMEDTDKSIQQSIDLLEKWHLAANGRLQYAFSPRFVVSCTPRLLQEVTNLADHYHVKVHTHAAENQGEIALVEKEHHMRNVVYLDRLGLTGEKLILAHCIWLDNEEMRILAQSGTNVVHCPASNLKLGSGIAPVPDMLKLGINLSLGADGAPCNNNLDQFMEMRLASLIQKPLHGPTALPAFEVFKMATRGGAWAMGLESEIGSLEIGKKADLVLLDLNKIHCSPHEGSNIYSQLVYQARAADVILTMVDGQIVYENDRLTTINELIIQREAEQTIKRIRTRAGLE
ncbi:MAG TPA: 5'-deoxyadenosine deaminase [Syntrophomonadaceae bacterium]|nr:5'-deoxyadenosine deaminase [Syntrophomonadaceae bacterium]